MRGLFKKKADAAGLYDPRTPLTAARFVVVDTELTGLDEKKDAIISIGAIRMTGGMIGVGSRFYRMVNPGRELSATSVVIHQITPSEVAEKPEIGSVLQEFQEYCGRDTLVGYFIGIDLAFLDREFRRFRGSGLANPVVDTFSIHEWLVQRRRAEPCSLSNGDVCRLYDIAKQFDIPVSGGHNAVMDAFITAQLLQRFLPLLAEAGVEDLEDLLRIGAPFKGGDRTRLTNEFGNF